MWDGKKVPLCEEMAKSVLWCLQFSFCPAQYFKEYLTWMIFGRISFTEVDTFLYYLDIFMFVVLRYYDNLEACVRSASASQPIVALYAQGWEVFYIQQTEASSRWFGSWAFGMRLCDEQRSHYLSPGMRIQIRSDPLIFGPPDPDPLLFSFDPDPTYNNGFIQLFSF